MSATRKLYRAAYRLNRAHQAVTTPGRFVRNRAKAKALSGLGFWGAWGRFWR